METSPDVRWFEFSGAPPILIPQRLAMSWRGTTERGTGQYMDLNLENPVTDYDHACGASWPGRGVCEFMGASILVLYTESDRHTWDSRRSLVACGGWLPTDAELREAKWTDPVEWVTEDSDFLLMNSAADGNCDLSDDSMPVHLAPGLYKVEGSYLASEYAGYFHRFTRKQS